MSLYKLKDENDALIVDLRITNAVDISGGNSIIIYESPGNNAGFTINTGRTNESIAITGKLMPNFTQDADLSFTEDDFRDRISEILSIIKDTKDAGKKVKLTTPITDNRTGMWVIRNFQYAIPQGSARFVNFTMTLVEHRQSNVKSSQVLLTGSDALKNATEALTRQTASQ